MGLTYRGTDLHTANIHLDVHKGYAEPADVRGEDGIILGAAGRFVRPRVKDHRIIELRGWVQGTGASLTAQQQSWRTNTDALMALLDMTLSPGALVLSAPDLGLAAGSKSINARCINVLPGPIEGGSVFQRWTIQLEAVDNPPDWV